MAKTTSYIFLYYLDEPLNNVIWWRHFPNSFYLILSIHFLIITQHSGKSIDSIMLCRFHILQNLLCNLKVSYLRFNWNRKILSKNEFTFDDYLIKVWNASFFNVYILCFLCILRSNLLVTIAAFAKRSPHISHFSC